MKSLVFAAGDEVVLRYSAPSPRGGRLALGGAQPRLPVYTTEGGWLHLSAAELVDQTLATSAYRVRAVIDPPLRIGLATAISAIRPATLTQQSTLELLHQTAQEWLASPD